MMHPGDLISALLDGELTAQERRDVLAHFEQCADCRAERDSIAKVRTVAQSLPVLEPPVGLIPEPSATGAAWWLRPIWAWAAAGVAALAVAIGLVVGTATPAPMDLDMFAEQHTARVLVQPGFQTVRAVLEGP